MIMAWLPAELLYRPAGHREPWDTQKGRMPILGGGSEKPVFATLSPPPGGGVHTGPPPVCAILGGVLASRGAGNGDPPHPPPKTAQKPLFL